MAHPVDPIVSTKQMETGSVVEDHEHHDGEKVDSTSRWYTTFYLIACLAWPFIFLSSASLTWSLPSMIKYAVLAILLRFSLFWGQNEAASFNPLLPPSFPLAVRNPYLSG